MEVLRPTVRKPYCFKGTYASPRCYVNSRAPAALGCLNEESVKPTKIIYCVH